MKILEWKICGKLLSDQQVVAAILNKDAEVTKTVLYGHCYPLFNSIFNKYYTDCETVYELINEIYLYILTPAKTTGRSKLEDFGFRCTFPMWLKIVTEHYCHHLFTKKIEVTENISIDSDRNCLGDDSIEPDINSQNMEDLRRILDLMPNERYRKLIECRYLEEKSNEETAMLMQLSMANYYNMHLRAKAQFTSALRSEGLI